MSDNEIVPEMLKAQLERDGYVQVRQADVPSIYELMRDNDVLCTNVSYRIYDWFVFFKRDFYDANSKNPAALNPLLRRAMEKIHDNQTIGKAIGEDGKKAIILPGIDRPVGEFAAELAEYYAAQQTLFYRPETSEVVRISMIKVDDAGHMILGLQPINENAFVTYLEWDFNLYTLDGRGERHIRSVQAQTAKLVLASVDQFRMRLPIVKRLLPVPIPRLINDKLRFPHEGYDPEFMSFVPEDAPQIKEMPLEDARDLLLNKVYVEFAFKSPQDRVNAIAHLLTPFCRGLFSRETIRSPLFMYIANREGAGKDCAAGIVTTTHEGEAAEDPPVTKAEGGSDEEFRKKIVAAFRMGRSIIHSSNNKGYLNSAELEALVTKEVYRDRQLGSNTLLEFPNTLVVSLSANTGLTYPPDLQRRSVFINLFLDIEDPNSRVFKNPDLHGWVKAHRSEVLSALYALVHNWVEKGMPKSKQPFSSFPEWQAVVGGILEAAGIGTPMQNDVLNAVGGDQETMSMRQLYLTAVELWGAKWIQKSEIFAELQNSESPMFGLFPYLNWEAHPESAKMSLGRLLSKYAGRIFADIRMEEQKPPGHASRAQYRFSRVGDAVPTQQKFQNNEIENNSSLAPLAPLAPSTNEKNAESNNNSNNIAIGEKLPILPKLPDSNTSLENLTSNPANPTSQNNGTSQPDAAMDSPTVQSADVASAPGQPTNGKPIATTPIDSDNPKNVIVNLLKKANGGAHLGTEAGSWNDLYKQLPDIDKEIIDTAMQQLRYDGTIYEPKAGEWHLNGAVE